VGVNNALNAGWRDVVSCLDISLGKTVWWWRRTWSHAALSFTCNIHIVVPRARKTWRRRAVRTTAVRGFGRGAAPLRA